MKWYEYAVCILLVLTLFVLFRMKVKIQILNAELRINHELVSDMQTIISINDEIRGRKFDIPDTFKKYSDNTQFRWDHIKTPYLLILVMGKVNCSSCIDYFSDEFTEISKDKLTIVAMALDANEVYMRKMVYQSLQDIPVFATNDVRWFAANNMLAGPYVMLIDTKTRVVLDVFCDRDSLFKSNRKEKYSGFLKSL